MIAIASIVVIQQQVDLGRLEAGDLEIEVQVHLRKGLKLNRENFAIPARQLGQAVVGDDVGPPLGFAQMRQFDDGYFVISELARRGDAAVSGDDATGVINQNRIHEIELPDRRRDLFDLFFRVCAGIPGIGFEIRHLTVGDLEPERIRQGRALRPGLRIRHSRSSSCTTPSGQPGRLLRNFHAVLNTAVSPLMRKQDPLGRSRRIRVP